MAYRYRAIYKHKIAVNAHIWLLQIVFNPWVIDVPNFKQKHYLSFVEKNFKNNIQINVKEVLEINFDLEHLVKTEKRTAVVIEPLLCTFLRNLCIVFFCKFNKKTREYDDQNLNALLCNIVGLAEATLQVSQHSAHQIALNCIFQTKTFCWQVIKLHKINLIKDNRWKQFLLGKNVSLEFYSDIYFQCSTSAKCFLDTTKLNTTQLKTVKLIKYFPNGIGLITRSAAIGKTALLVIIIRSFLWAPPIKSGNNNAEELTKSGDNNTAKPALDCDKNTAELALDCNDNAIVLASNYDKNAIESTLDCDNNAAEPALDCDNTQLAGVLLYAPDNSAADIIAN